MKWCLRVIQLLAFFVYVVDILANYTCGLLNCVSSNKLKQRPSPQGCVYISNDSRKYDVIVRTAIKNVFGFVPTSFLARATIPIPFC